MKGPVEAFLDELQLRSPDKGGPLVVQLPRSPGTREQRWAHLLCGPVEAAEMPEASGTGPGAGELAQRVAALESEVARLSATVADLCGQLGLSPPGQAKSNDRA